MMNNAELQARVREALQRTDIMALSSIDDDGGPWTSPVQYQSDSQLNLYFASMPDARHVHNIHRDARVAVAIYSVPGPPGGNLGLQVRGAAAALAPGSGHDGWQRFKIEPTEVWCFDSRVDRHRHRVEVSSLDQDAGEVR
jgi:pyridoxamine 5'-phosphate oxidase-like protein